MKLYKTDYHNISKEDRKVWKELEDAEIVYRDGKPTMIRNSLYHEFPKSARHYMSLFPNNFIDAVDLTKISAELHATLSQFEILLEKPDTTERTAFFARRHSAGPSSHEISVLCCSEDPIPSPKHACQ